MQLRKCDTIHECCDRAQDYLRQYKAESNLLPNSLHKIF